MTTWRIFEEDGILKVQRGNRILREPFRNEPDALKYVDEKQAPGDRILRVDEDGYETPVRRRRWRGTSK